MACKKMPWVCQFQSCFTSPILSAINRKALRFATKYLVVERNGWQLSFRYKRKELVEHLQLAFEPTGRYKGKVNNQ